MNREGVALPNTLPARTFAQFKSQKSKKANVSVGTYRCSMNREGVALPNNISYLFPGFLR